MPARQPTRLVAEITITCMGVALIVCAFAADQAWLDWHFLPDFFSSRRSYVLWESLARIGLAALGAALALVLRPRLGRAITHAPDRALHAAVAVVLALGASELVLRRVHFRAAEEQPEEQEPHRHRHPRLGWTFVPARAGHNTIGGRVLEYAFDPAGYRVRRVDEPVDPARPTILFTGESIMVGQGLTWDESVAGRVAVITGIQSANLAVHGFASDQAYLRLQDELPRFRQPVAVVSLFMPSLFDRNLDDDRPHLGPGLVWLPAQHHWRLRTIARLLIPYRGADTVERGIGVTREVLRATVELARGRGAMPLILVPQFGPELPAERVLRLRILDEAHVPYLRVELDPNWRIPSDRHPDPLAAQTLAAAIAARLRERLTNPVPAYE